MSKLGSSMLCEYTKSTEDQLQANERLRYHTQLDKKREQVWNKKYRTITPIEFEKINWEENLEGKGFLLVKGEPLGKTKYSDIYKCNIKPGSLAVNVIEQGLKEVRTQESESGVKLDSIKEPVKTDVLAGKVVRIKSLSKPIFSLYHKRNIAIWLTLKHRSLIVIYKIYATNALDKYYIFMDFSDSGTLTKFIKATAAGTGLSVDKSTNFANQLLHGLHYLHSNGISHRKLKADNIFVCQNANQIKISGIEYFLEICDVDHNGERSQCWMQHEHNGFNSIEAISNDPHNPFLEDVFSFGALFYYMLADSPPFDPCRLIKDSNHNCREHRSSYRRNLTNQSWSKRDSYKPKENDQLKAVFVNLFHLNPLIRSSTDELFTMDIFKK